VGYYVRIAGRTSLQTLIRRCGNRDPEAIGTKTQIKPRVLLHDLLCTFILNDIEMLYSEIDISIDSFLIAS
jgi:hypothetical protein